MLTLEQRRRRREKLVAPLSHAQGGLLGRRQIYALGLSRSELRAQFAARRWLPDGSQCVRVGPADGTTRWWRALLEVGPAAVLDGASALLVAGLRTITVDQVHVAVPPGAWFRRCRGVRVHETRRLREVDVLRVGIPRTKPATAAVHAALWARSDREAALFIVAAVQQRLVSVSGLSDAVARVRRHPRRTLLQALVRDVAEGIESLGERDFAALCARRGYPKPTRQQLVVLPSGRCYYDVVWEDYGVCVEIDGLQHLDAASATDDALKQNAATLKGGKVLRIPFYALRAHPDPFLDQLGEALRAGGWCLAA